MSISFADRVRLGPDVLMCPVGDESVLLNVKTERYFGLDSVGTGVWVALQDADSIQLAYDTLLAQYDAGADELRRDLEELLDDLIGRELVVIASCTEPSRT